MGNPIASPSLDMDDSGLIEGFARVVAIEGGRPWLEPEQTKSCGSCASAGLCSVGKDAVTARALAARRFPLPAGLGLRVGERVVVGVRDDTVLKGALTAYGIPLAGIMAGGIVGQEWGGSDALAALGAVAGLAAGLMLSRMVAAYLSARGALTPHFLRRAGEPPASASCH
ncbi:SoxR reducing system RseC family protein [Magnetospirillum sp. SS-4]|uniref:SoxR reducing system RseC family protein n=1 Tax=Magnetospirillum sp. SS-4 TaxID=2681465 RepID=UPI00137E4ABB|nr:SoxR reducing system RseC family protein [Magnetospirillum sp. SS-4]CAA7616332.1 Positive regulator of sigma E activity [Magnetospirillum sp. SS-4]